MSHLKKSVTFSTSHVTRKVDCGFTWKKGKGSNSGGGGNGGGGSTGGGGDGGGGES